MVKEIWFDMDGTLADLYGTENWLSKLRAFDPSPYAEARPLINMNVLARMLNKAIKKGYTINVISWLSKTSNPTYDKAVAYAKRKWLAKHLKSVQFTHIDIVSYGIPKHDGREGILFDDEERNRNGWGEMAYDEKNIIEIIKGLCE